MFCKLFFFLVIVCVVNASVLTVNVFDDDPKEEVASSPKDCNPQACDQQCRRLKFTGGACVRGRCKCDHSPNVEDDISEEEPSDLEDMVSLQDEPEADVLANPRKCRDKTCDWLCRALNNTSGACVNNRCKCTKSVVAEDDPEAEVAANPSRCRDRACDSVCRALNNTSGACVDGRCKCTKSVVAEDTATDTDVEDSILSRACNNKRCNQICRKQKFRGGACVGANCYCNKFLSQQEDTRTDPAESLRSCNSIACDDKCRRTGHSGICINGQCKCDYFLNTEVSEDLEDSVTPKRCTQQACNNRCHELGYRAGVCTGSRCSCLLSNNFFDTEGEDEVGSELSEDQTERGCNQRACDQLCRRLKFPGGAYVNGRFKCDNFFGTEDAVDEYSELDERRVCNITKCNRTCTRRGYEGAKCINGRCKCYNKIQKQGDIPKTSSPVSELLEDQNERGCSQQACEQLCRRLKFPGGACVNGRCKCDKYFGTEDAVDEYSELDARRGCRITKCNRTCTRLGYDSATCVNRRCKCYNKTQTQADISDSTLPVSELSEDENERGCNQRACDPLCRRLKFPGGACVNGRCKSDNFFGTEDAVDELPELETRRVCKIRQCNVTCTRRGYERARCVNGWCKCYNKIQREDASPLYEVTSDENEESYEILRSDEEELTDASPRACYTPTCNELCRRQHYAGGRCRFGQCRCF